MSTNILTATVSVTLVVNLGVVAVMALHHRKLVEAAFAAAATCATAHIVFVMIAWKEAASAYLDAPPTMRGEELAAMPPISSLPTAMYDAPAWAALAFLATGAVLAVIELHRIKAEIELAEALTRSLGVNEGDESEKD